MCATNLQGRRMELVRDVVVAAIDERRLMVAQFYIESRESALTASEEKYRNSIDHAPDPMYEIDPGRSVILGANAAAFELHHVLPEEREGPLIGERLAELSPPEMQPGVLQHVEHGYRHRLRSGAGFTDQRAFLRRAFGADFVRQPPVYPDDPARRDGTARDARSNWSRPSGWRRPAPSPAASRTRSTIRSPRSPRWCNRCCPDEGDAERASTLSTILAQITRIRTTLKDLVNFARPGSGRTQGRSI